MAKPLKIGLVSGEYPPLEGGVGAFTQVLAQALAAEGHELHIITSRASRPSDMRRSWRELWDVWEPFDIGFAQLHANINRWWWPAMGSIADVAARFELDLINVQYQAAAFDMRLPAINFLPWRLKGICPTVVTFHDLRVPYLFPKAGRLRRWVVHKLARLATGVIVTNQADEATLLKEAGLPASKVARIPIGSNITVHEMTEGERTAVRRRLGLTPTNHLLGYFGFLNESKGADTLLHALAELPPTVHLLFIGGQTGSSDPDNNHAFLQQLKQLITRLDLNERVHWSGFLPEKEVSAHLQATDLMVIPYRDGVSFRRGTLMAALAHGRPLITTRPQQPIPALVQGQNVWLTAVDDPAALPQAIQTLLADPTLRQQLATGAAQLATNFRWDRIATRTADFFRDLLEVG